MPGADLGSFSTIEGHIHGLDTVLGALVGVATIIGAHRVVRSVLAHEGGAWSGHPNDFASATDGGRGGQMNAVWSNGDDAGGRQ